MPYAPAEYALRVLRAIEARGFEAYLVGGCVRDMRLGRRPLDWDVCTDAVPQTVMEIFPRSHPTGIRHGTVTVISRKKSVEVTTFRLDGPYADLRRPDSVEFIGDLRADLARRDFTMNAVAMDVSGALTDPFGGISDIDKKIIRCVGDPDSRFKEDALRMLRTLRFEAALGFCVEPQTRRAIERNRPLIRALAIERVSAELIKALLSPRPEAVIEMLELSVLDSAANAKDDPRLKRLKRLNKTAPPRLSALSAVLCRNAAIDSAQTFLSSLRLNASVIKTASRGCDIALGEAPATAADWKMLLAKHSPDICSCAASAMCVLHGFSAASTYREALKSGGCVSLKTLNISGRDLIGLGFEGKNVGHALEALLRHVIEFPRDNAREILMGMARGLPRR